MHKVANCGIILLCLISARGVLGMPLYEYQCEDCGVRFERIQHVIDDPVKICPDCGGPVRRLIHPVGIVFKGSGFYVTDNRAKNSSSQKASSEISSSKPSSSKSPSSSSSADKSSSSESKSESGGTKDSTSKDD